MGIFDLFKPNVEKMESKKNVEGLIKAMEYKRDWYVRQCAAEALGRMEDERAVEPLTQILKHEKLDVLRKRAVEALNQIGYPATEPLIEALKDKDWRIQSEAVYALGKIGDKKAVEALIQTCRKGRILHVGDEETMKILVNIGKSAVDSLIQFLKDEDKDVRSMAARVLGPIQDKRAIEPITQLLKDKNEYVREAAENALYLLKREYIEI